MMSKEMEKVMSGVEFCKGVNGGLDKVILRASSVQVYLYGGQVTSWKNQLGEELLFLSSKATFNPPKAIRGGIPICFPQFSTHGPLESHGFTTNRLWSIDTDPPPIPTHSPNKAFIDLLLKPSDEDIKIWPHRWRFDVNILHSKHKYRWEALLFHVCLPRPFCCY